VNIVVLIKQVPDTYSERRLRDGDGVLDRAAAEAVLDEINERAVEAALQIKERDGGEVTVLTMGPARAGDAVRKALQMGADSGVHLSDEALAGSDAVATAKALAKAIGTVGQVDLIIAGNEASDGGGGAMAAMLGELLGLPSLTHAQEIAVSGGEVTVRRATDDGITGLTASLPAVVSVGEKINEPRYPSFKGIIAAKKKPVSTLTLADVGIDAAEVGLGAALSTVTAATPKPPKGAGEKIEDEGAGGVRIAAYLVGQKLV
jgi:electron transfer flavoprotein beta subunit